MKRKAIQKIVVICLIFLGFVSKSYTQEGKVNIDQDKDISKLLEYKKDLNTVDL